MRARLHPTPLLLTAGLLFLPGCSDRQLFPVALAAEGKRPAAAPSPPVGRASQRVPTASALAQHTQADYARQARAVQQTAAGLRGRFAVIIEPPFVVAGDSGGADVKRTAEGLIRWSVAELKKRFFARDPRHIITIWLFKDRTSYLVNSIRLTGETPGTPFGYYSPKLRALIMNIGTGGGTLVHEIVHPFMEANVASCPPWLNEGMGSLYEAVGRRSNAIWGYLNWRLPGLQRAIRARQLGSLTELIALDEEGFYLNDPGAHYAQARYLLYYLQDRGLLGTYFEEVLRTRQEDPSGLAALKKVLGEDDLDAFQRRWERYVLKLEYRNPPTR